MQCHYFDSRDGAPLRLELHMSTALRPRCSDKPPLPRAQLRSRRAVAILKEDRKRD